MALALLCSVSIAIEPLPGPPLNPQVPIVMIRFPTGLSFPVIAALTLSLALLSSVAIAQELSPGANVNMVSGNTWPDGDPFLQRQNEPSIAVSSRNTAHLLAGANDYRTVDIPGLPEGKETGDSWLGVFFSTSEGSTWTSTLMPGYPQDTSAGGQSSPLFGYEAGADPVVRAGSNGLFYYSGIVFDRGESPRSAVFVSRFVDLNDVEGGQPIRFVDTVLVDFDNTGLRFLDKPWLAVDVPRAGALTRTVEVEREDGLVVMQTVPCGRIYVGYAAITGSADDGTLRSEILYSSSDDCGENFTTPAVLSEPDSLNQGTSIALDPQTGDVKMAWRRFSSIDQFLGRPGGCGLSPGYWENHEEDWPVDELELGGVVYSQKGLRKRILGGPTSGDASKQVARHLTAAIFNLMTGFDQGFGELLAATHDWLAEHPVGSKPKGAAKEEGLALAAAIEALYHSGDCDQLGGSGSVANGDSVMYAEALFQDSTVGSAGFGAPEEIELGVPFDQGVTNYSFRTTAYPSLAVDGDGRSYVAIAARGLTDDPVDPTLGDAAIVMATRAAGANWSAPFAVDVPDQPGHQIKPSLLFSSGQLVLVYYDFRTDISAIFEPFVVDLPLADRLRHTVDVRAAVAEPGAQPEFTVYSLTDPNNRESSQTTRFPFLLVQRDDGAVDSIQLQYTPPNLPIFVGGTAPFIGDYVDVTSNQRIVLDPDGTWRFPITEEATQLFHASWADNRDVIPPPDGDWTTYVPPTHPNPGGPSLFDPAQTVPECLSADDAARTGTRNQNIYTSALGQGLRMTTPSAAKPLGTRTSPAGELLYQRAFVVFVQNTDPVARSVRLSLPMQPVGGAASFLQFQQQSTLDLNLAAFSSAVRTVFVEAPDLAAGFQVELDEITAPGGGVVPGGISGRQWINPDPTTPQLAAADLDRAEVYNPAILNPAIFNPAILNPAIYNPSIFNPAILNPAIMNPAIFNPAIFNPAIFNPAILNPAILRSGHFQPGHLQSCDFQSGDSESCDLQSGDSKPRDSEPRDSESSDLQSCDSESGDHEPGDLQSGDSESGHLQRVDGRSHLGSAECWYDDQWLLLQHGSP